MDGEGDLDWAEDTVSVHEDNEARKLSESRDVAGVKGVSWAVQLDEAGEEGVN